MCLPPLTFTANPLRNCRITLLKPSRLQIRTRRHNRIRVCYGHSRIKCVLELRLIKYLQISAYSPSKYPFSPLLSTRCSFYEHVIDDRNRISTICGDCLSWKPNEYDNFHTKTTRICWACGLHCQTSEVSCAMILTCGVLIVLVEKMRIKKKKQQLNKIERFHRATCRGNRRARTWCRGIPLEGNNE